MAIVKRIVQWHTRGMKHLKINSKQALLCLNPGLSLLEKSTLSCLEFMSALIGASIADYIKNILLVSNIFFLDCFSSCHSLDKWYERKMENIHCKSNFGNI